MWQAHAVKYKPIRSRWIVLAFVVTVVLAALCEAAVGTSFTFPRVLWFIPFSLLDASAIALVAVLLRRASRRGKPDSS